MVRYGKKYFDRIVKVDRRLMKAPFWAQRLTVRNCNGEFFTIIRHDRDFFEVVSRVYSGPILVKGWMDGLHVINCT
jgi:hypothetical protein